MNRSISNVLFSNFGEGAVEDVFEQRIQQMRPALRDFPATRARPVQQAEPVFLDFQKPFIRRQRFRVGCVGLQHEPLRRVGADFFAVSLRRGHASHISVAPRGGKAESLAAQPSPNCHRAGSCNCRDFRYCPATSNLKEGVENDATLPQSRSSG